MTTPIFSLLSMTLTLFLLFDAVGNVAIFSSLLKNISPKRQSLIIIREHGIALVIVLLFSFLGESLLKILNINICIVNIGGGVILLLIAIKMIFPAPPKKTVNTDAQKEEDEPFIVPLAIPLIAGPGSLATAMIYSRTVPIAQLLPPIFIALFLSMCLLLLLPLLKKILGMKFLGALERLMGMILVLIAIEMICSGIKVFFNL